ncbi:MAG TPA: poly(R)-hydroxyalkanoic acid synthase subunit PhaE [Spirochaetia bacterium]|nr:poly(R)-hydroxyalkanoic acid synthase subunit PhaE [Spirochaetia bacterium]
MSEEATNLWDSWRQYQEGLMNTWNSSIPPLWSGKTKETQTEKGREVWQQWWKAQEDFSKAWQDCIKNFQADKILFNPLSDPSKTGVQIYQNWLKSVQNSFSLYTPLVTDPATRDMMDKMMRSSHMYTSLASFWNNFLNGMAGGEKEAGEAKTLQKWQQDYYKILSEFFTFGLPEGITELIQKSGEVAVIFQQNIVNLFKPWVSSSPDLQEEFFRALSGDRDAHLTFLKNWQKAYNQSFGKLFHIPGVGPSGNLTEKMLASFDSYVQYVSSLNDFLAGIYKTGYDAMEGLSKKMDQLRSQGKAPASFKEFYDLWCQNNEDTYLQLFKTESFGRMLAEMVDAGARLKKRFDDIMTNALSLWPIPTQKDMDSVYKSIYLLKSDHRADARKMQELLDRLNRLEEKLNSKEVG